MSTDSERPAETPDTEDSQQDASSFHEQARLSRQISALNEEGERLANCQAAMRLKFEWDEATAEQFHDDLVEFIREWSAEDDQLKLGEVGIVLWDELSRIETMLRQSDDDDDEADTTAPDEESRRPERVSPAEGDTHRAAPGSDPTFQ